MSGISHAINTAKEALLAHQLSIAVAGNNVANVDTEGYTKQNLDLTTGISVNIGNNSLGSGVVAQTISRKYDQFMTDRIMRQNSTMGNLSAQHESLRVVETIFNESQGLALNDLMSQFWDSWQNLANNPEVLSARQGVVQKGELLQLQFQSMASEAAQIKYDIGVSITSAVDNMNAITQQIAFLNTQITTNETEIRKANDLRDQRDTLVGDLAQLIDINFFETPTGTYSVMMADGHSLVEGQASWDVDWENNQLYWLSPRTSGTDMRIPVGDGAELGGKMGGWLEVRGQLVEGNPDNYFGRLNALANAMIREVNEQHSQGVGLVTFSNSIISSEKASDIALLSATVSTATATKDIPAGALMINGRALETIKGASSSNGLAMAKAYNAAEVINGAYTGVTATLTTQVSGAAVSGLTTGETVAFSVNGIAVSYTATTDETADETAARVATAINSAITAYNNDPTKAPDINIEAAVGDGTNGAVTDAIILRNTRAGNIDTGDDSRIILSGISNDPANPDNKLGLVDDTYVADATHNTGKLALSSNLYFTMKTESNDTYLDHFGLGGGRVNANDLANDGQFTHTYQDNGIAASLRGLKYNDNLLTDGGSFDIWLYNQDATMALARPVTVSMERVDTLQDVADAINVAITNASGGPAWLTASVDQGLLTLTPDGKHKFAFANDSSNMLQAIGLNSFFAGFDAETISISGMVKGNLDNLAAGKVQENGYFFRGDNSNALSITNIQRSEEVEFTGGTITTLDGFYNSLVTEIGMTGKNLIRDQQYNTMVSDQLKGMRDEVSGVSLDEEMANLIRFQHAYSAAAKLITMSDEMLKTLLDSVR